MQASLTVQARAGAVQEVEGFVASFVAAHNIAADDESRVAIMLEELVTNLQKYGHPSDGMTGVAEIRLNLDAASLTIEFIDDGIPFDPFDQPAPDLEASLEDRAIGGLGLYILRELSHDHHYERAGNHNVIRLMRRVGVGG